MRDERDKSEPWDEEEPIPLDHRLVPAGIREAAQPYIARGCLLHRVPCSDHVGWWLLDERGALVEVMWLAPERRSWKEYLRRWWFGRGG